MIKKSIEDDLKTAMLAGDKELSTVLRTIKSVILDAEISSGKRQEGLSDDEVIVLLQKESKKRQEAAKIYSEAGDQERSNKETSETEVISKYLPEMMSEEEIESIAKDIVSTMSEKPTMQQMGQVIGQVKAKTGNKADGSVIANVVKNLISN